MTEISESKIWDNYRNDVDDNNDDESERIDINDDNTYCYKLCLGDFNVCSNFSFGDNGYNILCDEMTILGLNTDLYNNTKRTYCKKMIRVGTQSLDHMFVDDKLKEYVKKCQVVDYRNDERIASDHLGLLTTFQFNI